jgi:hypothetical protein
MSETGRKPNVYAGLGQNMAASAIFNHVRHFGEPLHVAIHSRLYCKEQCQQQRANMPPIRPRAIGTASRLNATSDRAGKPMATGNAAIKAIGASQWT